MFVFGFEAGSVDCAGVRNIFLVNECLISSALYSVYPPRPELTTTSSSDTQTAAANDDNASASAAAARRPVKAVLSVPAHVLGACLPDTMDEDLKDKVGEELVVLPNDAEARMLTNAAVLEILFVGRPKLTMALGLMPLAHHAEQLRCLLRLSKV